MIVLHDVEFRHGEVPIKNLEELMLDAAYVVLPSTLEQSAPSRFLIDKSLTYCKFPRWATLSVPRDRRAKSTTDFVGKCEHPQKNALTRPLWDGTNRCSSALLIYTKATRIAGILTAERRTRFEANTRKVSNQISPFRTGPRA